MKTAIRQSQAFTLLELMIVLVIVGVLAATVYPAIRLASDSSVYEERNQLHWMLLQVQQRSMQDTAQRQSLCPTLVLQVEQIAIANQNACLASASSTYASNDSRRLDLSAGHQLHGVTLPALIRFDSWGRPEGGCALGCTFEISASAESAKLCLAASGFIGPC